MHAVDIDLALDVFKDEASVVKDRKAWTNVVQKLRDQGKSLDEVLAANLTAPYDATTLGDTKQSKDRFISEVYDEVKDFPPVIDGERKMPGRAASGR